MFMIKRGWQGESWRNLESIATIPLRRAGNSNVTGVPEFLFHAHRSRFFEKTVAVVTLNIIAITILLLLLYYYYSDNFVV